MLADCGKIYVKIWDFADLQRGFRFLDALYKQAKRDSSQITDFSESLGE